MAFEQPLFKPAALTASADLSTKQFRFVKMSGALTVDVCGVDGEFAVGVLQNKPTSGKEATVETDGIAKVVCSEAVTAGSLVGTSSDGRAKIIDPTSTGADTGDWALGVALDTTTGQNQMLTVKLGINYRITA